MVVWQSVNIIHLFFYGHNQNFCFQEEQLKLQKQQQPQQQYHQHHSYQNMTRSQKEALKDFDAYELKNLEIENKKLTVINDDLLKVEYCPCKIFYSNSGNL